MRRLLGHAEGRADQARRELAVARAGPQGKFAHRRRRSARTRVGKVRRSLLHHVEPHRPLAAKSRKACCQAAARCTPELEHGRLGQRLAHMLDRHAPAHTTPIGGTALVLHACCRGTSQPTAQARSTRSSCTLRRRFGERGHHDPLRRIRLSTARRSRSIALPAPATGVLAYATRAPKSG